MTPKNAAKNKIRNMTNITKMIDKFDDSPQRIKVEMPSTSSASSFPYLTHFSSTTYRSAFKKFKKWKKEFEPTSQDVETMTDEYELFIAELKMYASCCMSDRKFKAIMDAVGVKIRKRKKHVSIKRKKQQIEDPSEQAGPLEQAGPSEQTSPSEQAGPSEVAGPSTSTASYSPSYQSLLLKKESLKFEIDNIRKVISCYVTSIKRWLSIIENEPEEEEYLQEYRAQADRLHELQCKESELQDQQEELLELEKLRELKKMNTEEAKNKEKILLIHLPNNQHTNIKIIEGLTLRDALTIPMQRRHLNLEDCVAYVCKRRFPYIISWDAVISTLHYEEVFIETLELISIPVYFTHNFVDNTFLLGQCCFCKKAVLHGWHCTECNRKFHTKCIAYAPVFCEHLKKRRIYYERLLANNETLGIVQIAPRPVLVPSYSRKRQYLRYKMIFEPPVSKEDKTTGMEEEEEEEEDEEETYKKESILKYKNKSSVDNAKANNDFEEKHDKKSANEVDLDVDSANHDFENIFFQENFYEEMVRIIENKDIIYGDNIGQGSFGKVMKGWIDYQGDVAVKKLWIENPTPENIETFKNEVLILQKLRHENVLSLLGCTVKPKLGIVTELCEKQSLYERLYDDLNAPIELITLVIISKQTAIAMEYLHSQNIIHRDLKSKNIFFYNGLHVKIGDFGLAIMRDEEQETDPNANEKELEKEDKVKKREEQKKIKEKQEKRVREKQLAGSVSWMAPEVLRKKLDEDPYSFQSDVYSFGIVLYELFARQLPYGNRADALYILYNVGRCALSPDLTKLRPDTPNKIKKILIQCIDFNKEERPLFPYIMRRTCAAFKFTPKIRRTTSLPIDPSRLADTYVEKTNDAQIPLTSEIEDFTDSYITDDTAPSSPVSSLENSVENLEDSVENLFEKIVSEVYFLRDQYRLAKRRRLV